MNLSDRNVFLVVPLIAAVAAFWFLALSPKQDKAKELDSQVSKLQSDIAKQRQATQEGRVARKHFPRDYHRLVVMGKAVPADDQTASLLVQISQIAKRDGVSFRAIKLTSSGSAASTSIPTAPPPSSASASSGSSSTTSGSASTTPASTSSAPATETAAASLPIGATVGSAGLPTLPYQLTFGGNFFQLADFLAGVDRLVKTDKARIISDGRLVTVDGFALGPDDLKQFPVLMATMVITTYVTPSDQGLTSGATPSSPPAASAAPASATTTGSTPTNPTTASAPTP
ncbi:MAG: hypothetical protein AABM43_00265 [Actinomycetota bacterium]